MVNFHSTLSEDSVHFRCFGFLKQGLGSHLLNLLLEIGRKEGIELIFGYILPDNYIMQRVCKNLGFRVNYDRFEEVMKAEITL